MNALSWLSLRHQPNKRQAPPTDRIVTYLQLLIFTLVLHFIYGVLVINALLTVRLHIFHKFLLRIGGLGLFPRNQHHKLFAPKNETALNKYVIKHLIITSSTIHLVYPLCLRTFPPSFRRLFSIRPSSRSFYRFPVVELVSTGPKCGLAFRVLLWH